MEGPGLVFRKHLRGTGTLLVAWTWEIPPGRWRRQRPCPRGQLLVEGGQAGVMTIGSKRVLAKTSWLIISNPGLRGSLGHKSGVITGGECRVVSEALVLEGYVEAWPKEFVHIVILKLGVTGEPVIQVTGVTRRDRGSGLLIHNKAWVLIQGRVEP